ncbi:hypothetical protein AGMMS50239_30200 [Bacteroidia bacterium]|nr:hypothetical protein AGMMS50239_30200 [Bacteroidia bacterium]
MKNFIIAITVLTVMSLLESCERELMSYEGDPGIYFAVQSGRVEGNEKTWPYSPYTTVEFVKITGDTYTVNLKIMATGEVKEYDRPFRISLDLETTTGISGVDYETIPTEGIIPAGKLVTYFPIVLHRTVIMEADTVKIGLQLAANEHFKLTFPSWGAPTDLKDGTVYNDFDASKHVIRAMDILVQPAQWLGGFNQYETGNPEFNTFGAFTPKKFKLLSELTGYVYTDFMTNPPMTAGLQAVLGRFLADYLIAEYKAGRAVTENDGRLMWADGCPWKSYAGIPWNGEYVDYWQ